MMIAIDGNEANVARKVGVSVYTSQMLTYFKTKASPSLSFTIFLRRPPRQEMPRPSKYFQYQIVKAKFFWSQLFLPLRLYLDFFQGKKYDVFFSPAHYIPRFCPAPTVVTVHDLSYHYYPNDFLKKDLYKLTHWTEFALKRSARIISVSKTTKKDIVNVYKIKNQKIIVIYNGYERKLKQKTSSLSLKRWSLSPKKYFLYVGTIQPRKNLSLLLQAFGRFVNEEKSFKLVIVGKKGWLYRKLFTFMQKGQLEKGVVFTDYIPNEELALLYRNALSLVIPSLYEGFGIPVLEAFSYRCPVISSFTSSLPEIGGNGCLYFNPLKVDELYDKMKAITNRQLRKELIKSGARQLKNFSWQKSARQTLSLLKEVASQKK